jgi:rubrerythrin
MLASVLKKIGLRVGIILVPKHAYLVVYDKDGKKREFAIESTGIAHQTLSEAIHAATDKETDSLRKIEHRLDDATDEDYHEVAIEDCRRSGIQPIPYAR